MMNRLVLFFFLISSGCYGQFELESVEYYLTPWNRTTKIGVTLTNFHKLDLFYTKNNSPDLLFMFDDSLDCSSKLNSRPTLQQNSNIKSVVKLHFENGVVLLGFDAKGNYFYDGSWHSRHLRLYYNLFKYFSEELISAELINEAFDPEKEKFWDD